MNAATPLGDALAAGLDTLGVAWDGPRLEGLLAYLELLVRWNRVYNLTAVRDPAAMVTRHLLDSLAIAPWIPEESLVDVGSGAGLPGIPLALLRPHLPVTLLDASAKRTRFLHHVALTLPLDNVAVVQARVQDYRPPAPFAAVVSRAFASLGEFATAAAHLRAEGGAFYAMKGEYPAAELEALAPLGSWRAQVKVLAVPGLAAARHLAILTPGAAAPKPQLPGDDS